MKKIAILSILLAGLAFVSCKKDKTCECTRTVTTVDGAVSTTVTDPMTTTEIKGIKGGEAKTLCQKSTVVAVDGTETETTVNDCKLK